MTTHLSFWRQEAEKVSGVLYYPRNEETTAICRLMGTSFIRGESRMDELYETFDKLGIPIDFFETDTPISNDGE